MLAPITMTTLLLRIEQFLADHPSVTATELGKSAVHDPGLVFQLRRGRSPRARTVERVDQWMSEYGAGRPAAAPA